MWCLFSWQQLSECVVCWWRLLCCAFRLCQKPANIIIEACAFWFCNICMLQCSSMANCYRLFHHEMIFEYEGIARASFATAKKDAHVDAAFQIKEAAPVRTPCSLEKVWCQTCWSLCCNFAFAIFCHCSILPPEYTHKVQSAGSLILQSLLKSPAWTPKVL